MASVWREARLTVVPLRGDRHGPLPPLLLALTVVTGLVDAVSYLALGHVFVANMTGNVVIIGFALAGAQGFSVSASLTALVAFCAGAAVGGRVGRGLPHRGRALCAAGVLQTVLFGAALSVAAAASTAQGAAGRYAVLALTALAMGVQNAVVRSLAVPDLTTTVLTLTVTGVFADGPLGGGHDARAGRRLLAAAAMLAGALAGAELVLHQGVVAPLATALAVLVAVTAATAAVSHADSLWAART